MRTVLRQALSLVLLALVPAAASAFFHPKRPAWKSDEITLATTRSWRENVLWVDARAQADFEKAHIPGAVLLNENTWDELLLDVLRAAPGRALVVYCSSSRCQSSHEVARRLRDEVGLPHVYVLRGGWEAWLDEQRLNAQQK